MKHPTMYRLSMATAVGITLSLLTIGDADAYTFSRIFDDSGRYNFGYLYYSDYEKSPAINNQGTVAFKATSDVDPYPYSYDDFFPHDFLFTGNGQSLNRIISSDGLVLEDLNDSNTVALTLNTSAPHYPEFKIFTTNGDGLTPISQEPNYCSNGGDVGINNEGNVVFLDVDYCLRTNPSIVVSDGVNYTTIVEKSNSFPANDFASDSAINNNRLVAFGASFDGGFSAIFTGNGDSITPIADTDDIFSNFGNLSLNDSDTLAFAASLDDGSQGIFTSNGGGFTTIVDTSGSFSSFFGWVRTGDGTFVSLDSLVINNNGTVAFEAVLDTGEYGIFTGANPVADKVIAIGDSLFGSTVTSLKFSEQGFNDVGQVAFLAQLADGSSGIFIADPDPNAVVLDWGGTLTKPIPATLKPIEIDDFSRQETLVESPGVSCNDYLQPTTCRVIFQEPQNRLGFGFTISSEPDFVENRTVVKDAVSVKLFDAGENLLGTLRGDATIDPSFLFVSGFFGVESTVPFIRAEIQSSNYGFSDYIDDNIVFDNLRYELVDLTEPATVPEPATGLGLLVIITIGAGSVLRHKQK